jgi:two-component system sensor histidine kinase KdpD
MGLLQTRTYSNKKQYALSILIVALTALLGFFSVDYIGHRAVALILMLAVSLTAILFDIIPVLIAALLSALIWNFFFIPPILTFHIDTPEDVLMFLMYFVIALINTVLTFKIREFEQKSRVEEEKGKSIQLYNTLLNSLSHELKTPISTIIGAIDTIKDNETKLTEHNKNELYTEIEIAGLRLNRQVENLLNMNRLEAKILQPKLDWVDVNELIFDVIRRNSENATSHQINFEVNDKLPLFRTDGIFIEQIFQNIIYNALQHTPSGSTIGISVESVNNGFVTTIVDNGQGFPSHKIELVFNKFYRLNNSKTGGTGLGLSIAKGFSEALGGNILLENLDKGGAKFCIFIPAESSYINNLKNE